MALRGGVEAIPLPFYKAWPAAVNEPPSQGNALLPYLRIGRVSVAPTPVLMADGKPHNRAGTLIVTLVHPIGMDEAVYIQYAGQIANHFAEGYSMYYGGICVKVSSQPHVMDGYLDDGYWTVPVSIPWRTFA